MTTQQNPNLRVWLTGQEYLEASEILLDYNRLWPAVILASLSIEVFLKAFLARRLESGLAETEKMHPLQDLYTEMDEADREALRTASRNRDSSIDLEGSIRSYNEVFVKARYMHEPGAWKNVAGSDIVYFARHLWHVVYDVAKLRGV